MWPGEGEEEAAIGEGLRISFSLIGPSIPSLFVLIDPLWRVGRKRLDQGGSKGLGQGDPGH